VVIPDVLGTDQLRALVLDLLTKQGLDAGYETVLAMDFTELVAAYNNLTRKNRPD
jgi:hypothetical protein